MVAAGRLRWIKLIRRSSRATSHTCEGTREWQFAAALAGMGAILCEQGLGLLGTMVGEGRRV